MTNDRMAQGHLLAAREIFVEAENAPARGVWNLAARRSQEAVKLALQGIGEGLPALHTGLPSLSIRIPTCTC